MHKIVLIDDEKKIQNTLKGIIESFVENVEIVALANNVAEGIEQINKCQPDIVFLDIDMPDGTGFDLLKKLSQINFSLIFCTAFDQYAVEAFKYNAIDYILKPFDVEDVKKAINKAQNSLKFREQQVSVEQLLSQIKAPTKKKETIVLKTLSDIFIVKIKEIYNCQSDGGYTTFMFEDNKKVTVSNSLKDYEDILFQHNFIKTHQSHIINPDYIERIHKKDGACIIMNNGREIPISSRKKESVFSLLL